jgi:glycosyltransferase involved in cell wall biosynthesis
MRLVFVTQKLDADDPILGATVEKVRALAERCEHVHVLALAVGRHDLPANVTFATFGASTRLQRGLRYARALVPALLPRRPDALIAHMCPIYLVLAAPFAKPLRIPLVVWYTHWTIDSTLRLATRLCDAALSVERHSYPLDSVKVIATGHGIDVDEFTPRDGPVEGDGPLRLLGLGRTSPSKGFMTLLAALESANERGLDIEVELRGPSTTDEERGHRQELLERIESGPLRGRVRLENPVSYSDVPALLRRFDAVVNPTRGQTHGGALDKVVYEAAASAVPVFACNPHFATFLGGLPVELLFRSGEQEDLAAKLIAFAAAPPGARAEAGRELRRRVVAGHSSRTWAEAVTRVVTDLRRR